MKFFACFLLLLSLLFLAALPAQAIIDISLQMQLGNPSNATADTNNYDHYLIQRTVEAIDYSDNLGEPNWVSWDLTTNDIGNSGRNGSFYADTNLPANFYHVAPTNYDGVGSIGFARGHMCPSEDRTDNTNDNKLVFFMSNIIPQDAINNSGVWGTFEDYCRSLAQTNELLITCGPSGFSNASINTNGRVYIPAYVWKIAVVVPFGNGTALSRITNSTRVIALKIPNSDAATNAWPFYATSASQIEIDTGFTFFTALPANVAAVLRGKVDGQTNSPPIIFSFLPTNGVVNDSVTISGTNFNSAAAVTFNGASAFFAANSNTQITAIVPTNAGTGFISVTTSNGTAVSSSNFTVNGSASSYTGTLIGWDVSTASGYGVSPFAPSTNAPNLTIVGLTRGGGVGTSGSGAGSAWGGVNFTNATASLAIAANKFFTFGLAAKAGYNISLTSISRLDYRRSSTGPTNGVLQFQIGSGAFTDITNLNYSATSSSGGSIGAIDLTSFAALQNVGAGTNVTFRVVNYLGTSSSGSWYIYDVAGSAAADLAVQGTVTQMASGVNILPVVPQLSLLAFTNNQFQFTLIGTSGANYVVQAATNLVMPNWIALTTNASPFMFTDSNANLYSPRFYRGMAAP